MKEFLRFIKKYALLIVLFPLRLLPVVNNRVFIINSLNYTYSDSQKVITEYLLRNYPDVFEIVYVVKEPAKYGYLSNRGIILVRPNSFAYFRYIMTSRVIISNSGGYSYAPLHKSQFVINTWHGGGAYKTAGVDMFKTTSWMFRKDLHLSADKTDVFLSTNKRFSDRLSVSKFVDRDKFWEIGMPRSDELLNIDQERVKQIREKIGLKPEEKLVLFAPTYRKTDSNYFNESIGVSYGIDVDRVLEALRKRFGGTWRFAVRLHPMIADKSFEGDVLNLSSYEDMQEILMVTDVMINDFSSSIWDFLLTGRPGFIFALDLEDYVRNTKVYTPVKDWPYSQAETNDELVSNILSFDEEELLRRRQAHYDDLGYCESGKATQLVCEKIHDVCFPKA